MKLGKYQIPFDANGNQQHYPEPWYVGQYPNHQRVEPNWQDNHKFSDVLTFDGYSRGRSAAYFGFLRADGRSVTVFLKEFEGIVPHMVNGKVSGTFSFIKRGQNYGCVLVEPEAACRQ